MNVEEALLNAEKMPEDGVLVAKAPVTWGSEAMFVELTDDHRIPKEILDAGYQGLLDRDDILFMLVFLKKKKVGTRAIAEFVIHYAIYDCYPEWINDIPDA